MKKEYAELQGGGDLAMPQCRCPAMPVPGPGAAQRCMVSYVVKPAGDNRLSVLLSGPLYTRSFGLSFPHIDFLYFAGQTFRTNTVTDFHS